ncbi:MAG: hypothetical protein AAFR00_11950 [Pseudomonadota bacterium]
MISSVSKAGALVAISTVLAFGSASAQAPCTETQMTSRIGQVFLNADNFLRNEENPQAAQAELAKVAELEKNCYEEGIITRLRASIKFELGDYEGAARDMESAIDRNLIAPNDVQGVLYQTALLYLQSDNRDKALSFMERWIAAGATPTRDQNWQLAVLYQQDDQYDKALPYAERVFSADGPEAERQVYDFLILLYDRTGQLGKKAQLLETLLERDPTDRSIWDAIAYDYSRADDMRSAFEIQKAMYLSGMLTEEDELMRVVNFYNEFDVPYAAAKTLEKEMNAGRIARTPEKMELLVNLYQVAREFERAIPIIEQAAQAGGGGKMYERLGRSYAELQEWEKTEEAMTKALDAGGLNDRGAAWVLIGQSRYEREDRAGAREAFRNANSRGGRGWLAFMDSEDGTAVALRCFDLQSAVLEKENEKKACDQIRVLGEAQLPETCSTVEARVEEAKAAFAADEVCVARAS